MKQINLLPWREHKNKLKIRRLAIVWLTVSGFFLILLLIAKIIIIQQIKHCQLTNDHIYFQIKNISSRIKELKKLKDEEKELRNIVKTNQINHRQIKKIQDLINRLQYLITPDLFVRLIEFYPPYLSLIMHANSEKEYVLFKQILQSKFNYKIRWLILNQFQNLQLDFFAQIIFTKE
ncbi:MAG: hypothetical protein E6K54_04030 [Gammaproteobacteria bacterium]|nr:MAG: hypothetical protein E6K54_04030 [Gammaproteobacteria bacterium]